MMTKKSRQFWTADQAIDAAATRADANGAPVAVVLWRNAYWLIERADTYDRVCESGGISWAVLDPDDPDLHCAADLNADHETIAAAMMPDAVDDPDFNPDDVE